MLVTLERLFIFTFLATSWAKKPNEKPSWAKKDITDFNDADLERLYEQWEEDEEPLPVDELPEWDPRRPQPQIDLNSLNQFSNPEDLLKLSKKGKTLMIFVKLNGNPTREQTEEISSLWQTGLWNTHIQVDRFLLEDDRVIFMFKDGAVAWEAKDFLIEQERCEEITIEQKVYYGKYSEKGKQEAAAKSETSSVKKRNKKKSGKKRKSDEL